MGFLARVSTVAAAAVLVACAGRAPDLMRPIPEPEEAEKSSEEALSLGWHLALAARGTSDDMALGGWLAWMHGGGEDLAIERFERALSMEAPSALAYLGLAEAARGRLDYDAAAAHCLALLEAHPGDILADVALILLESVLGSNAEVDEEAARVLSGLVEASGVPPATRIAARELLWRQLDDRGDPGGALDLARVGAPPAWTVAGPFSRFSRLETEGSLFRHLEEGAIPPRMKGPFGEIVPWVELAPEGRLELLGTPPIGDVFYAAVDVQVPEEDVFLLSWSSRSDIEVVMSGVEVLRRDDIRKRPPVMGIQPVRLSEGSHRLIVRVVRAIGGGKFAVRLLDDEGRPAGLTFELAAGEPERWWNGREERNQGKAPVKVLDSDPEKDAEREIARRFKADPSGALASYFAALRLHEVHRDHAKAHAELAMASAPKFAPAYYLSAWLAYHDPALPRELRIGRAGSAAEKAGRLDPSHVSARILAARIAIDQGRYDDGRALLDEASIVSPHAPWLARTRARLFSAKQQYVLARGVLEEAYAANPDDCGLAGEVYGARRADDDIGGVDEIAAALRNCGSSERLMWADHLARRGDRAAAIDVLQEWTGDRPTRTQQRVRLAELLAAEGLRSEASAELEGIRELQPASASLVERLAGLAALDGDDVAAFALRGKALELDPGSLRLRRALAFQQGEELLEWAALDLEEAIKAYQADEGKRSWGTDAVLVVDHAGVEVFAEDPVRPVVVERVQMVTRIMNERGLEQHGEVSVPSGAEIIDLHTRKPDGRLLDPEITPQKETITLAGLEVGDFIVLDYLLLSGPRSAPVPGWTSSPFFLRVFDVPLHKVTYVARAPVAAGLEVEAGNIEVSQPAEKDGYLVFSYEAEKVEPLMPEHDSPYAEELLPWVRVGAGSGPDVYGDSWGDYEAGRARVDHGISRFADEIAGSLPQSVLDDRRELVHVIAEKVNERVRGSVPSTRLNDQASHALARGRGNRLLVTRALLSAFGMDSRIVLVRPFDADPAPRRFPSGDLYRYAVLRADPADGGPFVWIDQNLRTAPIGSLRPVHSGASAILLAEPGRKTEVVTTPEAPKDQESRCSSLHLIIDEQGNLTAEGLDTYTGFWAATVREGMKGASDERRRQAVEGSLAQFFGPIHLQDLELEGDGADVKPGAPLVVRYRFTVNGWARVRDDVIEAPGGDLFPALISRRLVRLAERNLPLLLQEETVRLLDATFSLPEGYSLAGRPDPVSLNGRFGSFLRTVEEEENGAVVRERFEMALTRVDPGEYVDFVSFAAKVDRAQARGLSFDAERVAASSEPEEVEP